MMFSVPVNTERYRTIEYSICLFLFGFGLLRFRLVWFGLQNEQYRRLMIDDDLFDDY